MEHEQLSLFGDVEAEHDITWRILAEPFITEEEGDELEQSLPRWEVALVGFNSYGAQISMVTHQSNVTVPLIPVDSTSLPGEAEIDDALLRRRKKENDQDVSSMEHQVINFDDYRGDKLKLADGCWAFMRRTCR